jgi:hypothetical protein
MVDSIDERLERLKKDFNELLGKNIEETKRDRIFVEQQERDWLLSERDLGYDFRKAIVKPLDRKRKGHFMLAVILLSLTLPRLGMAANSPTEFSQPHKPTAEVTLPCERWVK